MNQDKQKRIFWLGMHVVLVKTELARLRQLGYEVFNPPYLSDVYDQSAVVDWDKEQPTTLPQEAFYKLSQYNFFYNAITPEIAELLDEYFGTVIVTISPSWLKSVLDAYHGRVIYRVYGQPGTLTDTLWHMRLFRSVQERENFYFVPHAAEAVRDDHAWLKTRMSIVPYTLPLDVYDHENSWSPDERHAWEIMVCCPNIDNSYYTSQYNYLNEHFPESHFKLYGVQPRKMPDYRIAGTLPRQEQLSRYRRAAGYFYHYQIPSSTYLPPIEMMTIGGPVVYMNHSLLSRSFTGKMPGEANSIEDAKRKVLWLLDGDRAYIDEVRQAQHQIVRRYHPDFVNPIFDRVFTQLLDRKDVPRQEPAVLSVNSQPVGRERTYVMFHAPGKHIDFQDGVYQPVDALAHSVKRVVQELLAQTEDEVVVTCSADQFQDAYGYLEGTQFLGRLRFLALDPDQLGTGSAGTKRESNNLAPAGQAARAEHNLPAHSAPSEATQQQSTVHKSRRRRLRESASKSCWTTLLVILGVIGKNRVLFAALLIAVGCSIGALRVVQRILAPLRVGKAALRSRLGRCWRAIRGTRPLTMRRNCITCLNSDSQSRLVIVPHGSLFPEAIFLERPIVLYTDGAPGAPAGALRRIFNRIVSRCVTEKAIAVISPKELTALHQAPPKLAGGSQASSIDSAATGVPTPRMGYRSQPEAKSRREEALAFSQASIGDERIANRAPPQAS